MIAKQANGEKLTSLTHKVFEPSECNPDASEILRFYNNRSVLITGGSGFVGKVLIEKLLRTCHGLQTVFVLLRPRRLKQGKARLADLTGCPLFDIVRSRGLLHKLEVVEGDVTRANLGIQGADLARVLTEVSVVFHSAATVKFDEPLKQAVDINLGGTKHVIELCRKMQNLAAIVHVSTAYANCEHPIIGEHVYTPNLEPDNLIQVSQLLSIEQLQGLRSSLLENKPNTYTYTKAMAESWLMQNAREMPIVICRPSIVLSTYREPFAGWVDNINGPAGATVATAKGILRTMVADADELADLIPVDLLINMIVTLGWFANVYGQYKRHLDEPELSESADTEVSDDLVATELPLSADQTTLQCVDSGYSSERSSAPSPIKRQTNINNNKRLQREQTNRNHNNHQPLLNNNNNNHHNSNSNNIHHNHNNLHQTQVNGISHITNSSSSSNNNAQLHAKTSEVSNVIDHDRSLHNIGNAMIIPDNIESKLRRFRQNYRQHLRRIDHPELCIDIPVFNYASAKRNQVRWGRMADDAIKFGNRYPPLQVLRVAGGSLTKYKLLNDIKKIIYHQIPAIILDTILMTYGSKPYLSRVYRKIEHSSEVLACFTCRSWDFNTHNGDFLYKHIMSDDDRRIFDYDLSKVDWDIASRDYSLGLREFVLKEPIGNLDEARRNLKAVYYRNLTLEVVFYVLTFILLYVAFF